MWPKVSLLRHPYPYKCSFSICNDCDFMSREAFETIHQFINTDFDTKLGKGLKLPIADSMFMYSERPGVLSYFDGLSGRPGRESSFLVDSIKEGWIDSLHGYGDFLNQNATSRELACAALNELEKKSVKLKVWIDHGSSDNSQNLSVPRIVLKGDNSKCKAYHTDLLKQYGITFVAGYNSDLIGQNGTGKYLAEPLHQSGVSLSLLKRMHGRWYGKRLLQKKRYRDDSCFFLFCRARNGVLRPDISTLGHQLRGEHIRNLRESGGTMILYQHLGAVDKRSSESPYLEPDALRALESIAEGYHSRVIWVAPTHRVLQLARTLESITLRLYEQGTDLLIEVMQGDGQFGNLLREDLQNVSFRVQNHTGQKIVVKYDNYSFKEEEYEQFEDEDGGIVVKMNPTVPH